MICYNMNCKYHIEEDNSCSANECDNVKINHRGVCMTYKDRQGNINLEVKK